MSLIVSTSLGRFRHVVDSQKRRSFLFECPTCGEWLPMSEEHLSGSRDVQQLRRGETDRLCEYFEAKVYGATLVATMQARFIMMRDGEEIKPYDTNYASLMLGE
jgi:phage terminase large subunit GpA-like protein